MNTIVSLKHEKVDYVASLLRKSIDTHINSPCLTGKSFSIQALPHKNRDVAKDIIQGCGGKIVRGKATAGAEELTEDSLQALYDSILRAKA